MIKDCSLQGDPWAMVISSTQSNLVHENQSRIELRCSGLQPHQKKDRSSKARDSEVQIVAYKRGVFGLVPCEIGSKLQKAEQLKGTMWDRTALGAAFHGACSSGLEDVVRLLYKQRTGSLDLENMLTRDDTMEETALLKACRSGSYSIVLFLLAQGGDPNKVRARQDSPLHWLCAFEGPEVPKIASALVKAGADLKTQATAIVCQWDEVNCPELSFASGTPLHRAVSRRCWEAVNCLLELGADPNERSNFAPHDTPITLAVSLYLHGPESTRCRHLERNKQKSILEVLLAKSTDFKPNQQYLVCGRTRLPSFILRLATLQRTAMYGWRHAVSVTATLDLLEKLGERFSDPASGYSLLHLAIQAGDIDVVAYLLQKYRRDDINLTFKYGDAFWHPPLFYAINGGHFEIFMHLLRCGADPFQRFQTDYILGGTGVPLERLFYAGENMEDFERGRIRGPRSTYLHICATSGAGKRFATKLLNQGCKLNSYDSNWESPLFLSVINCDFELADFFVEYGASTELLRDDRTMLGHLVEDGFLAPYAAFDYLLKAQLKFGPKGSTGFMAVYKEYRTWLHVLMDFWDTFRNPDWAEALFDLFARRLPDTRLLDIQIDMYGDTVLHFAIGSINILAVKRLLHWGADPNVPNYKVGISCDLVLKMVFDTMSKHGITGQTLKAQSFPESSLKSAVQEVRGLEEIFQLLKSHGGLCTRGTPPWEKDFNMSNIGEDGKEVRRREELGVDLRSINDETDTTDGPCQEICNEIAEDMNKQIAGKQLDWNGLSVITTRIIICHLLKAPEVAYTSRRLFRFEQYLGTLIGSFASLHLEFDRKLYGWRIELNRIPGGGIPGAYVLSPPTKSETELPLHSLKPEHQLSLANRRADLAKLNVDVCTSPLHTKISVPISQWEPLANAPQERRPSALRLKESLSASKADLSGRGKLGPVSMIRLKQLLPSDGYRVIIGAGDELADLMYPDRPPPAGTRILVSTLTSGSIISFTVA
jgi:ankyrin repeat protein